MAAVASVAVSLISRLADCMTICFPHERMRFMLHLLRLNALKAVWFARPIVTGYDTKVPGSWFCNERTL
jgi:hypothetical protein